MKNVFYYISFLFLFCSGCNDFLEYKDKDKIIPKELKHFNELIYGEIIKKTDGNEMMYLQLLTDETVSVVIPLGPQERNDGRTQKSYFTWAINEQLDENEKEYNDITWAFFYHKILMCNIIENNVNAFEEDNQGVKYRLLGETAFLRAMSYYYLVNLYGQPYKNKEQARTALGVPINTAVGLDPKIYTRATLQKNYDLIEKDLLKAIDLLQHGEKLNTIFRPNRDVAHLFLSRIYLEQKEWGKALSECNLLISQSHASIETKEHMQNYLENDIVLYNSSNPGILFSWGTRKNPILSFNTRSAAHWEVNPELKNMYGEKDIRSTAFFSKYAPKYPNKYTIQNNLTCYNWSYRIEEAYLNRAEACIELGGNTNIQQAMSDINVIRQNRIDGEYEKHALNAKDAMTILRNEKKMEFCFEGIRWFDIRRWGIEIIHKLQYLNTPEKYDTYVLKSGSPNYVLSLPLEVQKINDKIEKFEREETLVNHY